MGLIRQAYLGSRGIPLGTSQTGGGSFVQSQPGDAEFSYANTPDSQAQYPAAAAERRVQENQRRAQNILSQAQSFGIDTSTDEYAPVREAIEKGFVERSLTLGERLIGFVDGPRQFVNLAIQDIAAAGSGGTRSINIFDYADALWGGIESEKRQRFIEETGYDPISGSRTLELFGWDLEDTTGGRFARGATDFSLQMLTDPLNYLSFGLAGLGKKVALQSAREIQQGVVTRVLKVSRAGRATSNVVFEAGQPLVRGLETSRRTGRLVPGLDTRFANYQELSSYEKTLVRSLTDITRDFTENVIRKADDDTIAALRGWMKVEKDIVANTTDDVLKYSRDYIQELAIHNRVAKDIVQPLVRKDFAAIPKEVLDSGLLPAYLRGGARLSFPLLGKPGLTYAFDIPGTRGLGRKIVGDPVRRRIEQLRGIPVFNKVFRTSNSLANALDQERSLLRAVGRGDIQGWQYNILGHAIDSLHNESARSAIKAYTNAQFAELKRAGEAMGFKDNGELLSMVWNRIEKRQGVFNEAPLKQFLFGNAYPIDPSNPASMARLQGDVEALSRFEAQLDSIADDLIEIQDTYYGMLEKVLSNTQEGRNILNRIKNYIPHELTKQGQNIVAQLASKGSVISRARMVQLQREGHPGAVLLSEMVNAVSHGGRIEEQLGSSRHVDHRRLGASTAAALVDNGIIQLPTELMARPPHRVQPVLSGAGDVNTGVLEPSYMTVPEMNEEIAAAVRLVADDPSSGFVIPRGWDGKLFNDNPLEVVGHYIDNLHEVVRMWQTIDALKMAGLAFEHSYMVDIARTAQAIMKNLVDNTIQVTERLAIDEIDVPGTVYHATQRLGTAQTSRRLQGDNVLHFGTAAAATQRLTNIASAYKNKGAGHVESALLHYKKPLGTQTDPVFDTSINAKLDHPWTNRVIPELGRPLNPNWNDPGSSIAYTEINLLRDAGYDVIIYRNAAEDAGSISFAVLDSSIIESKAIRTFDEHQKGLAFGTKNQLRNIQERIEATSITDASVSPKAAAIGMDAFDAEGNKALARLLDNDEDAFADLINQGKAIHVDERYINQTIDAAGRPRKVRRSTASYYDPEVGIMDADIWELPNTAGRVVVLRDGVGEVVGFLETMGRLGNQIRMVSWAKNMYVEDAIVQEMLKHIVSPNVKNITGDNVRNYLTNVATNRHAARMLHKGLLRNLGTLDDDVLEYVISGKPAELVRFETDLNEWMGMVNALLGGYGHFFNTRTGLTLPSSANKQFSLLADEGYENMLDEAIALGKRLEVPGLEKVLSDVKTYAGIADRPGFVNPAIFALGGPAVESLTLQKDVAVWIRQLARNSTSIYTPEGVAILKLQTNSVLRMWKSMSTIMRPAFHVRNFIGGVWNNMLIDVRTRDYLLVRNNGIIFRNAIRRGVDAEKAFELLEPNARKVFRAAWDNDVMTGFASSEFRKLAPQERSSRLDFLNLFKDEFALNRMGGLVMESIEDFMRVAAFARWYNVDNPATARVAKEMAERVHFNYTKLTPMETRVKSVVPFFVWTRRNLPLQLEMMFENPKFVQRYRAMMQSMSDNFGGSEEGELPSGDNFSAFAAGTDYFVHPDTPFWARVMIDPDLPVTDLLNLRGLSPPDLLRFANDLAGPHVSTLFDLNREREFGDVNAPAPFNIILKSLAAVGFFDNTTSGDVRIPYYMRTLVETAFPMTRDVVEPFFGGPTDPARQARAGIAPDADPLQSAIGALGSTLLRGMGIKYSTPTDVRQTAGRTNEELDRIVQELRFQGGAPPSER